MYTNFYSCLLIVLTLNTNYAFAKEVKPSATLPAWKNIQLPSKVSLRGSAIKAKSIWVSGNNNTVFVSQDGGSTWQNKSVPSTLEQDFRDIALFDKNTAIVMGAGSGPLSTLYKTTDGGNSWQLLYQNTDKLGFFNSIAFWSKQQGLLLGDPVDGFFVIKKTDDGGKTWRRISVANLPIKQSNESAFAASGNSVIVSRGGKAWIATGGFSASVYSSSDFGETWQRNHVPLYQETQTAGGYSMAINQSEQPFIVGGDYLNRSKKYNNTATFTGNRWQSVKTGNNGLKTAMSCIDLTCILTGKLSNDISLDSGTTWQAMTGTGYYTLSSDSDTFVAAGANGTVGIIELKSPADQLKGYL